MRDKQTRQVDSKTHLHISHDAPATQSMSVTSSFRTDERNLELHNQHFKRLFEIFTLAGCAKGP